MVYIKLNPLVSCASSFLIINSRSFLLILPTVPATTKQTID